MKIYILLVLTVLFWSGNFIVGRYINEDIHPMQLSLFRWVGVLVLLLPYIYYHRQKLLAALNSHFIIIMVLSALGIAGFNTFLYYGLQETTATNALLINSSTPILIILLNALFNKVTITKVQFAGIFFSTLGVIFLVIQGDMENLYHFQFNKGDFWIIASSLAWALYSILLRYKPPMLKTFEFISIITLFGVLMLAVIYWMMGFSFRINLTHFSPEVHYSIIYMVIFPSLLSFYFWNRGVLEIGANKTGQFTHLMPIFGAILAYTFLNEMLEPYHIYGIILIGLGIYLSLFYKKGS